MKTIILTILLVAIAAICTGCKSGIIIFDKYSDSGSYSTGSFDYAPEDIESVSINWVLGNITIIESESDKLSVTESGTDLDDDEKMHYLIKDGSLTIQFWESRHSGRIDSSEKNLTVEVPKGISLNIKSVSSNISADELNVTDFSANTTSGDIKIDQITADSLKTKSVSGDMSFDEAIIANDTDMETTSGNIDFNSIESDNAKIECVSGDVSIHNALLSNNIEIETTSGDIDLGSLTADNAKLESVSGDASMKITSLSSADIKTTSGDTELNVPNESGASVDFSSVSGDLEADREYEKSKGTYIFGNGDCIIKVKTTSGDLDIN